ncbi:MAG: TonB-dependent receptor [Bacteroidetes bacterium]|nr:MAG: TonB-dependent receptor [Bacteroidota bacterium]REK00734.1 MAG: TonB-dependent receptor [Bacteroidota bacterium]REK34982.1 MAG: TonB-dependent receptor [Bacteroidota bacterium]REK48221.1 MAG: TonB-dependent receptor [Bacteroidota bacterium]
MSRLILGIVFFILNNSSVYAQTAVLKGRISNKINNEPIPYANVFVEGVGLGATSDSTGNYRIEGIQPGQYNIRCSFIGFKESRAFEVQLSSARTTTLNFELEESSEKLEEVVVRADPFNKTEESPLSLRSISATEIFRNPGGNRDISKVIQILPGVASTLSFRNDLIVRGGAPGENRFYLDGIEVPNINHFATQGSSGGPVGMINVNLIREVDFFAGAFPASKGNALSSVMEFKQREGNDEKTGGTFMIGSSDVGLTLEGPLGEKTNFLFSARRSYLQLLFKALALPFLPTYNDAQFKVVSRINDKNSITLTGIGAIDDFRLNTSVNEDISNEELIERNRYILGYLPVNTQWNYAGGVKWTRFIMNGYQNIIVSRNQLENRAEKYSGNVEEQDRLLLDYRSVETETKVRIENIIRLEEWKILAGGGYERADYRNNTFNKKETAGQAIVIDYNSKLSFNKYSLFAQISRPVLENHLTLSFGLRTDFSDYSVEMNSPLEQISPRISASYALSEKLNINFNAGKYFQLPPYTLLGYRDSTGSLVNKENGAKYISSTHLVSGLEYSPTPLSKISLEGFYKIYNDYPFLLNDSISLANLGADFGVIGNEAAVPESEGRSYGLELLMQQKLSSSIYGILSYTYVRSEFKDKDGNYVPSSWDNRHILNITAGKKLRKNWELGIKFRLLGGAPYTPYDVQLSSRKEIWELNRQGIPDWNKLNTERNPVVHGLDVRIDKKWFFNKWSLNAYLDIQNIYNFQAEAQPFLDLVYDENGTPQSDPASPDSYLTKEIKNTSGNILPSVGLMLEF